ncbi:MAG: CAP domain-containing protein [Chloroflexota bacterium]
MLDAIRGLAAFAIAGLATTISLGHIHVAPAHHTTPTEAYAGVTGLDLISAQFIPGVMAKAAEPVGPPAVADNPPAPEPVDNSGGAPAYSAPRSSGGSAPAPAVTIGSAQQSYINADRAAAGLPPLTWSSCLAGVAYSNAVRMANAGAISHAGGVSSDMGCGLGSAQTGENVGYWSGGINDAQLNSMFMGSPGHRANIMGPYRYVGTAWKVAANGAAYIAVEFG